MALARELNDWVVHQHEGSQGPHFVGVKPALAIRACRLNPGRSFTLAATSGPSFEVTFDQSTFAKNLGQTFQQEKVTPASALFRRLAIGVVVAVLALGGWTAYNSSHEREVAATVASLAGDQKNQKEALARVSATAAASISQDVVNRMRKATFLVVMEDAQGRKFGMGTAWAVGPNTLATNAHIAGFCDDQFPVEDRKLAECNEIKPGEKCLCCNPGLEA